MIVLVAAGLLAPTANADGKFYARIRPDRVPSPTEPFQRALICFDGERELLLIQPSAQGADAEFGWIVPVPSVPAVGALEEEVADHLFELLSNLNQPRGVSLSGLGMIAVLGVLLSWIAIGLMRRESVRRPAIILGVLFLISFLSPATMSGGPSGPSTVNVLNSGRVGIYETKVVQAEVADDLIAWLRAEEFAFDSEDVGVFEDAVARGWCFVVSKIAADAPPVSETYLDPILLEFETEEVIYPYALTATVDHPVTVSLSVIAPTRVGCEELTTRVARRDQSSIGIPLFEYPDGDSTVRKLNFEHVQWVLNPYRFTAPFLIPEDAWYTWLYRTIEPGEVGKDLVLTPRKNEFYRWWVFTL